MGFRDKGCEIWHRTLAFNLRRNVKGCQPAQSLYTCGRTEAGIQREYRELFRFPCILFIVPLI